MAQINYINIKEIKDILTHEVFSINTDNTLDIEVPLGGFRFIDIELKNKILTNGKP